MTRLMTLTVEGVAEARLRLQRLRDQQIVLHDLADLFRKKRWAQVFDSTIEIDERSFSTRREAAEYLSTVLGPIRHRILDHAGIWSFLGMFYLNHTPTTDGEVRVSPLDSCYLLDVGHRARQRRYRHYLWGALQLYEQHGHGGAFLLDEPLTSWTDMAQRAFGSVRVFNARGVIPLMQRLYARDGRRLRGAAYGIGGARHLLRVLNQRERTHDVYGEMAPSAILKVLPQPFHDWDHRERDSDE